jgi:hypothetical protein
MKYFSSRICNFYTQKLSTTAIIAATEKLSKKRRNFVNYLFYTYNIKKKKIYWNLNFLIPKF